MSEISLQPPKDSMDPVRSLQRKLDIGQAEFSQYFKAYNSLKDDLARSKAQLTILFGLASQLGQQDPSLSEKAYTNEKIRNEHLQRQVSEIENSKAYIELQLYLQKTDQELIDYNKKIEKEAIVPENATGFLNRIKRNYQNFKKHFLPTTVTAADLAGTTGFVTHIYLNVMRAVTKISEGAKFFFGAVSSPLAIAAMGAGTLLETYALWHNEKIKQRKTRYGVNFATLGLLGVAMPIVLGVLAAPIVAVPLIFLGLTALGYAKDAYILKQTQIDLMNEEMAMQAKQDELQAAIQFVIANDSKIKDDPEIRKHQEQGAKVYSKLAYFKKADNINKYGDLAKFKTDQAACEKEYSDITRHISQKLVEDPKIQRLAIQVNDHKDRIASLNMTIQQMKEGQQLRKVFLFSVGCLLAGGLFTLIPPLAPLAALFTLVGAATILGAVFVGTYLRYKHKHDVETAAKANQQKDLDALKTEECNTTNTSYQHELARCAYEKEQQHLAGMEAGDSTRRAYATLAATKGGTLPHAADAASTTVSESASEVVGLRRLPSTSTFLHSFEKGNSSSQSAGAADYKSPKSAAH